MYAAWPTKGRAGVVGQHMHPLAHMDSLLILNLRMLLTIIVYQSYASLFLFNINLVPMCAAWPTEGRAGVIGQHMHPLAHKDSFSILNFENVSKIYWSINHMQAILYLDQHYSDVT